MGTRIAASTLAVVVMAGSAAAQNPSTPKNPADDSGYTLKAGTRLPLSLMNTVSSKNAAAGDQLYLETLMPVIVNRRVVVPPGSHVVGTITDAHRPGKIKGKGDLYLRFDSLILASGAVIDLTGRIGGIDGGNPGTLSREEGKITSDGAEGRDAMVVAGTTFGGTAMGRWIGDSTQSAGIGAGAGAAAGLAAVLLTRGPDAVLQRGAMIEMVLNRDLRIAEADIPSSGFAPMHAGARGGGSRGATGQPGTRMPMPRMGRGIPWWF